MSLDAGDEALDSSDFFAPSPSVTVAYATDEYGSTIAVGSIITDSCSDVSCRSSITTTTMSSSSSSSSDEASVHGLSPLTAANGCIYPVATLTLGSMTFQSWAGTASSCPTPTSDPCDTFCRDASSLLYRHEHTDELCRSIFLQQADKCFDCVGSEPGSEYQEQGFQEMVSGGVEYCGRTAVGKGTIAGSVIGGVVALVGAGIGVFWWRRRVRRGRARRGKGETERKESEGQEGLQRIRAEMLADPITWYQPKRVELKSELQGVHRVEMDGRGRLGELDAGMDGGGWEKKGKARDEGLLVELPANEEVQASGSGEKKVVAAAEKEQSAPGGDAGS